MEEGRQRELQLLLPTSSSSDYMPPVATKDQTNQPLLDLSLTINGGSPGVFLNNEDESHRKKVQALKEHAAEQIRLAALERAYAERMRELTRKELELAEKEFARARLIWDRARQEVEKAERMKVIATRRINSNCIEITCQACQQHFQP